MQEGKCARLDWIIEVCKSVNGFQIKEGEMHDGNQHTYDRQMQSSGLQR